MILTLLALISLQVVAHAWNPTSYPFLPASTDTSKVRDLVIHAQGANKKILDVGCGSGYSTSDNPGSMGVDTNSAMIKVALETFPEKNFKKAFLPAFNNDRTFDVVTSMFYFHDIPRFKRKKIVEGAIQLARERVVIVDFCPEYKADYHLMKQKPFLKSYLETCRHDLHAFDETPLVNGLLHIWIHDKKKHKLKEVSSFVNSIVNNKNVNGETLLLPITDWKGKGAKWTVNDSDSDSFDEIDLTG